MEIEDENTSEDAEEEREARLQLLVRFAKGAGSARFMARLGRKISQGELRLAENYASALGFPHVTVAPVADFAEAAEAAESLDIDAAGWETSEQLRVALSVRAAKVMGPQLLHEALEDVAAYVAGAVRDAVKDAAASFDIEDEALINTAAGAALRACHNAALVLLAGEAEDHPLALEYALFEGGRWPIALTGQTLHLF